MKLKIYQISIVLLVIFQLILAKDFYPRNKEKSKQKLLQRAGALRAKLSSNQTLPISDDLKSFLTKLQASKTQLRSELIDPDEYEYACSLCSTVMEDLIDKRRILKRDEEYFRKYTAEMCIAFEIQTPEVCRKMIDLNLPIILFILDNTPDVGKDEFCLLIFQEAKCDEQFIRIETDIGFKLLIDEVERFPRDSSDNDSQSVGVERDLNIIHITDLHVDFDYLHQSNADCLEPSCCHEKVSNSTADIEAGFWGDYRQCDSPYEAILNALNQIKKEHSQIDMIYFTGDVVDHTMWETSVERNVKSLEKIYDLFREIFGTDIPIYSTLGNHEGHPVNSFAPEGVPEEYSSSWLYNSSAELWSSWLPENATDTILQGGYYTALVRPGLRLIALNNNYCYVYNWWLLYDESPYVNQFQWLHDTLLEAEEAGEHVHILTHIPNGLSEIYDSCSEDYQKIINRFHRTIKAQFNGHVEFLHFNLFFSSTKKRSKPINVAFNGGSLTTFSETNRNYVLYKVDPVNFEVKDLESWIYNLTEANLNPTEPPRWYRQFSFKEAFNLTDLSPKTLKQFAYDLAINHEKLEQYWRFRVKDSDLLIGDGCDSDCKKQMLCEMVTSEVFREKQCKKLKKLYDKSSKQKKKLEKH